MPEERAMAGRLGVLVIVALVGASDGLASDLMINQWCPVLPDQTAESRFTTTYQGKVVGFCCARCVARFEAEPEKYARALANLGSTSTSVVANQDAHDHEHHDGSDEGPGHSDESTSPSASNGHSHAHATDDTESGRMPLLGRLHPVIVHFPVAGIPLALLGFLIGTLTGRDTFARSDVVPLTLAAAAAVAAVITGNIARASMQFTSTMHGIVERHEFAGTTLMILILGLTALRLWRWQRLAGAWRWIYCAGLLAASLLVGVTGYLGGSLVFGPDHLKW